MEEAALIDANVLVYTYAEDSQKRGKATDLLLRAFKGKSRFFIALQTVGEFCSVATRKYRMEPAKANSVAQALLRSENFTKLNYKNSTFERALNIVRDSGLHFWDAMLTATMLENGVATIYTEDMSFARVEGIKAVNLFREES